MGISHLEALRNTIARAVQVSPYYARTYEGIDLDIRSEDDLDAFPLLERDTLATCGQELMARGIAPFFFNTTEGTTFASDGSTPPLLIFKDEEEYLVRQQMQEAAFSDGESVRPLFMHLVNLEHGLDPGVAMRGCFVAPLERAFHLDTILHLLRGQYSFEGFSSRVNAISGPLRMIKALTLLLIERRVDSSEFEIGLLSCSGNQLTTRWRQLLEGYWQAPVHDVYGLSEVPGLHAISCDSCGHFHFSSLAYVEVLALNSDQRIETGVGRLIASSLYPLGAIQPMIRYNTRDLIELKGTCEATGKIGFSYLGRRRHAVILTEETEPRLIVNPLQLNDILDSLPDIAIRPHSFVDYVGLRSKIGFQAWRLETSTKEKKTRVELHLELNWSPLQFPESVERLRERLDQQLSAAFPLLASAIASGELNFCILMHEPGTTDLRAIS